MSIQDFDAYVDKVNDNMSSLSKGTVNRFIAHLQEQTEVVSLEKFYKYNDASLTERDAAWKDLKTRIDREIKNTGKLSKLKNKVVVGASFLFKEKLGPKIEKYQTAKAGYDEWNEDMKKTGLLQKKLVEGSPPKSEVSRDKGLDFGGTVHFQTVEGREKNPESETFGDDLKAKVLGDSRCYFNLSNSQKLNYLNKTVVEDEEKLKKPELLDEVDRIVLEITVNDRKKVLKGLKNEMLAPFKKHIDTLLNLFELASLQDKESQLSYFEEGATKMLNTAIVVQNLHGMDEEEKKVYEEVLEYTKRYLHVNDNPDGDRIAKVYLRMLDRVTQHAIDLAEERL